MEQIVPTDGDSNIELRFRNAGIVPPADRAAGTFAEGRTILQFLHWLRAPRTAAAEPSNIFSLVRRD